ncbi:MAG: hypothetical protein ACKV2U_01160 [Bryobacteraceae bacterium]
MRPLKLVGITLAGLASLYILVLAGFYVAMCQPPERFGAIMSRLPMPAMMILPFKPLWMSARADQLAVGDAAPDFALPTADRGRVVKLSEEWRERPVVLIFGSYT